MDCSLASWMKPQVLTMNHIGSLNLGGDLGTVAHQGRHHPLGVHGVLVAAQRHQCDARAVVGTRGLDVELHRGGIRTDAFTHRFRGEREYGEVADPGHRLPPQREMTTAPGGGVNVNQSASISASSSTLSSVTVRTEPFSSSMRTLRRMGLPTSIHTTAAS